MIIAGMAVSQLCLAQSVHVPVRFKVERGDFSGTRVDIVNKTEGTTNSKAGRPEMRLVLKPNCDYLLEFNKPGYITKKISFNTSVPQSRLKQGMDDFPFAVHIFPQVDDVNIIVFNQPVGKIYFDRLIDDFDFDTDYTKQIRSAIKQAEEEILKKADELAKAKESEESDKKKKKDDRTASEKDSKRNKRSESVPDRSTIAQKDVRDDEPGIPDEDARKKAGWMAGEADRNYPPGVMGEDRRPGATGQSGEDLRPGGPFTGNDQEDRIILYASAEKGFGAGRRMATAFVGFEDRIEAVRPASASENGSNVNGEFPASGGDRTVDVIKENNRTITKVTVTTPEGEVTLYSKVVYNWGARYFFKGSASISKQAFKQVTGIE